MGPPTAEVKLVNNYARLACFTAFAYDWLLTIGDEVEFVWGMAWLGSKMIFMLLRYITLVEMGLIVVYFVDFPHAVRPLHFELTLKTRPLTQSQAPAQSFATTTLMIIIVCIVQVLLQLRIYIVYGRSRKLLWSNAVLFVVELVILFLVFVKMSFEVKDPPVTPMQQCHTCRIFPRAMGYCLVAPLIFETYLLILMVHKSWTYREVLRALSDAKGGPASIMDVLVRGSVFYFLITASGMALSLIMFLSFPRFALWTDVLSSATACVGGTRLIISMRKAVLQEDMTLTGGILLSVFGPPVCAEQLVIGVCITTSSLHRAYQSHVLLLATVTLRRRHTLIGDAVTSRFIARPGPDSTYDMAVASTAEM
ncbi:hypothetical protein AURDEDRAFT_160343 [Auricularia subglabra TFB-10046 SS5]|nr:hypothetical protein AURDEDRAFT_160343 [Auricularia subglabra TFB-10046 SS5]